MSNVYEGHLLGEGLTFGIVVSRFNSFVTEKLLAGALDALKRHGVDLDTVDVFWTPGAFEIPGIAKRLAESERYDAVLCLGAVIRGATPHFDYVAAESAKGNRQHIIQYQHSRYLRGHHHGYDRTSTGARRYQGRKQRV